jgi:hypothetical protein
MTTTEFRAEEQKIAESVTHLDMLHPRRVAVDCELIQAGTALIVSGDAGAARHHLEVARHLAG